MAEQRPDSLDPLIVGGALAFVAGFADASTFVGADGVFCAHVTGNFVIVAADLAQHARADEWMKLATFPVFVASVLVSTWLGRRSDPGAGPTTLRRLLGVEAALFGVAAAVGATTSSWSPTVARAAIVGLLVVAMGIQNALHRLKPTLGAMTTVMTGNLTHWLAELVTPAATPDASKRRVLGVVLASFALGCLGGAWGVAELGFVVLAAPMLVVVLARAHVR